VYYHQGFNGRSQPLEMMLVATKADWVRKPWAELQDPTCFAAPAVAHDQTGKVVSQTTAAAQWLGTELMFSPPTGLRAEGLKMALDIADLWSEAYGIRKSAKSWEEIDAALGGRIKKFFMVLEACATKYGKGYMVGDKPTYVDFCLLNVLITCEFMFGKERMVTVLADTPKVAAACAGVLALPGVEECKNGCCVLYPSIAAAGKMPFA